jgi:hypothetical protein
MNYYKIEVYSEISMTWKPIQKIFNSLSEAKKEVSKHIKARVMEFNGKGYSVNK